MSGFEKDKVKDTFNKSTKIAKDIIDVTAKKTKEISESAVTRIELIKDNHEFKKTLTELGLFVYNKFEKEGSQSISFEECLTFIARAKEHKHDE